MDVLNFHGSLSQKYLPRVYCENKLLAKLNRFTVCAMNSEEIIVHGSVIFGYLIDMYEGRSKTL